jgi:hypothetical protein
MPKHRFLQTWQLVAWVAMPFEQSLDQASKDRQQDHTSHAVTNNSHDDAAFTHMKTL